MDIEKFIKLRPHLYHLTDPINYGSIMSELKLNSTTRLAELVKMPGKTNYLRTRRIGHEQPVFSKGNFKFRPRDQDPLVTDRTILEGEMTFGDWVYLLNCRVFFWAKKNDLEKHYNRYKKLGQNPFVFRVSTRELFDLNTTPPMFCHLNSGAPSHWTRGLPARGQSTFLLAEDYSKSPSSVREVTFTHSCKLPKSLYLTQDLSNPFVKV